MSPQRVSTSADMLQTRWKAEVEGGALFTRFQSLLKVVNSKFVSDLRPGLSKIRR